MICLADNDIIKKLAICNLLDEAIVALGVSYDEILGFFQRHALSSVSQRMLIKLEPNWGPRHLIGSSRFWTRLA
jgi:hypothetical protein